MSCSTPEIASQGPSVAMQNVVNGPLISATTARTIGESLLREKWGSEREREQLPLTVEDQKVRWRVVGQNIVEPYGQFCLLIRKADGLIEEIGIFGGPYGIP